MYGKMYLNLWPTIEELSDTENDFKENGYTGYVGAIQCKNVFWKIA